MTIRIDTVRIAGFRGIENLEVSLPRVTLLIGTNNSGKTSIIRSLQLALGDYIRFLCDEDFHIDGNDTQAERILVDLRIIPVDEDDKRKLAFDDLWVEIFGDKIQSEADGKQFLPFRTECKPDSIKGGFSLTRYTMERWPEFTAWQDESPGSSRQFRGRFDSLPFIYIDAQRDIHHELKERSSFIGRLLSTIEYEKDDVEKLEEMVATINEEAVNKSPSLSDLRGHLNNLNQSFAGNGETEITPFPRKIRDLAKHFSIHFGETSSNSFSMEYHGMGTRSWASMLAVRAFIEHAEKMHAEEFKPFFPIQAAEEPEAHLHPNAQRTLFSQLKESKGQVIISTHSPYLAALAELYDIRNLVKNSAGVRCMSLIQGLDPEDINMLHRTVLLSRGEVLFSKCLILFEGMTEEQLVPAMFEKVYGKSLFSLGIDCISVGGKCYSPFVKLACSLGISVCIVSDNDGSTKAEVDSHVQRIKDEIPMGLNSNNFFLDYLSAGNDIEAELVKALGLRREVIEALVLTETRGAGNPYHVSAKETEIQALTDDELIERMRASKTSYSGFLAGVIKKNPQGRNCEDLVPLAIRQAFEQIRTWFSL